jgi:hypothetical protein
MQLHEIGTPGIIMMIAGLVVFSVVGGIVVAQMTHVPPSKKEI